MKRITVKTQQELDILPNFFEKYTIIEIKSTECIYVYSHRKNSSIEVMGNSSIVAWGDSKIIARENSKIVARENSSVEAWGNSSVEARENSTVEARGNSKIDCFFCSTVVIFSPYAVVKSLLDNAHAIFKDKNAPMPANISPSAKITKYGDIVAPTFDKRLERIKNHPRVELRKRLISLHKVSKGSFLKYRGEDLYLLDTSHPFYTIPIAKVVTRHNGLIETHELVMNESLNNIFF